MTAPVYRADSPALRRTIALDGALTLIFHRPSATTHVVAAPVPEILAALADGPADADALMQRLRIAYDVEGAIEGHLDDLVATGLVTRG